MDDLIPIVDHEFDGLEPHQVGQLWVEPVGDGMRVDARVRHDADEEQRRKFRDWVVAALDQLVESGDPEANGWYRNSHLEGWWFMTCAECVLPRLDD